MTQDSLFWLLSTVSQTMAALVAVVGVVVVFRLDHMSRSVTRLIDRNLDFLRRIKDRGALRSEAESLVKFAEHYDEHKNQDTRGNDDLATEGKVVTYWRSSEKQFSNIRNVLKWFFAVGLGTTGFCLLAMPFTKWITACRDISIALVIIILMGSLATLLLTAVTFFRLSGKFLMDYKGEHISKAILN